MDTSNIVVARLSPDVYRALVAKVNTANCQVTATTTDLQAGFMLGVQHVLQVLREQGIAYASGDK